jgi:hypothetical protein
MGKPYKMSLAGNALTVISSDGYDGLPEKMMRAFAAILNEAVLQNITHVYKVDDSNVIDHPKIAGESNITLMEQGLCGQGGDYFAPADGYRIANCSEPRIFPHSYGNWSMKISNTSYWYNRDQPCNDGIYSYAGGGFSYLLSRAALGVLTARWPQESMPEYSHTYALEDVAVGTTLHNAGVALIPVELPGMVSPLSQQGSIGVAGNEKCSQCYSYTAPPTIQCCWFCEDWNHTMFCPGVKNLTENGVV